VKLACSMLLLVACAAPSVAPPIDTSPEPTTTADSPECPAPNYPGAVCPEPICPTCRPRPLPVKADWYCMDLIRPNNAPISGYCYASLDACEVNRKAVARRRLGKATPCVTQEIAYCVEVVDSDVMNRQLACARTEENCRQRRQHAIEKVSITSSKVSDCRPLRSSGEFTFTEDFAAGNAP
jgi:hypothetical protein